MARWTVERPTPNNSATSRVLYSSLSTQGYQVGFLIRDVGLTNRVTGHADDSAFSRGQPRSTRVGLCLVEFSVEDVDPRLDDLLIVCGHLQVVCRSDAHGFGPDVVG